MPRTDAGHRATAHTADLRVEAWAPTREECVAHAVAAVVESVVGADPPPATTTVERDLAGETDADLLAAAIDEVVYLLETRGLLPSATEVRATPTGLRARFAMVDADALEPVGAIPKAVSLHRLRCERGPEGWWCTVTVDV
ncbi:archease [Nocardiopsis sp. FIRDI 009]|uniref:archease n=1 Tax=Nocardiopsis sp. FIRDI 009 TaxID=714197 RepID=UPI000E27D10A|nr:archease [Nocardiopsis sp. FIRDI 009]